MQETKYRLAAGTQVREEDFGLLFYTMNGPRLYFLQSGRVLGALFFKGEIPLERLLKETGMGKAIPESGVESIQRALHRLAGKGVIVEC